jgi:hypothetical protein
MNISVSELARKTNQSPQNFCAKLKRDSISYHEMREIASSMGIKYMQAFILPNGEKITD